MLRILGHGKSERKPRFNEDALRAQTQIRNTLPTNSASLSRFNTSNQQNDNISNKTLTMSLISKNVN